MDNAIWNRLQKYARINHSRTINIHDYSWDGACIVLGDAIWHRTRTHASTTPHQSLGLQLRRCLHCHGWCYSKSFANVYVIHSTTSKIYDYSWGGAYIVMGDAIRNRTVAKVRMTHPRTIGIYDYSSDDAYIVMDDAMRNCLQKYAWPTPGLANSMIIAETKLALSRTMLCQIVCKRTHDPC